MTEKSPDKYLLRLFQCEPRCRQSDETILQCRERGEKAYKHPQHTPPPKAVISTHMAIPLGSNTCKFCPACDLTWPLRSKWLHQSTFCATTMEASTWNSFSILACTCILCVQPIYHKEMQLLVEHDCWLPKYVVSWRRITAHKVLEMITEMNNWMRHRREHG